MTGNLFEASSESPADWFVAWCDGGSRGNPGPAGFGAVVQDPKGGTAARLSQFLGVHTNNYAEYQGLLAVLEWALGNGVRRLRVISDSELMVKQMKGQYKVASPALRPLWEEAKRRAGKLERFEMRHTLRGGNAEADRLANDAMDRGTGKNREQGTGIGEQGVAIREQGSGNRGHGAGKKGLQSTPALPPAQSPAPKAARQVLDGYVKNGVVHLLEGSLPEGAFVKIIRE